MVDFSRLLKRNQFPAHSGPVNQKHRTMSLETQITELTKALQENTAALLGAKTKTTTAKAAPAQTEAPAATEAKKEPAPEGPTLAEFRATATKLVDAGQQDTIKKINAEFNLKRVSDAHGTEHQAKVWAKLKSAADALDSGV